MINEDYTGNLLEDYKPYLLGGYHLAIMPISRVEVEWSPLTYPAEITFYPVEWVELDNLGIIPNKSHGKSPAEIISFTSGVDQEILNSHPLIVFPCNFNWRKFRSSNHRSHMEFIRTLSNYVDKMCLNFIRYLQCPIDNMHALPGKVGTINSNRMMSGALLYNHSLKEGRIIGGDAFTHAITRGLGLPIESVEHNLFPKEGEVGSIINHALALYTLLLETESPTFRFVQALSLLEFLANPDEYQKFAEVSKIISRYIAKDRHEYKRLLDRFFALTGKKDLATNEYIGLRTRIVHLGGRLEEIIPQEEQRKDLFIELGSYIKAVIDHMIKHSEMTWVDYLAIRDNLRPYEI